MKSVRFRAGVVDLLGQEPDESLTRGKLQSWEGDARVIRRHCRVQLS